MAAPTVLLQLFSVSGTNIPRAVWRMAADRARLRRVEGLRFAKLLGTGDGRTFDFRDADPGTWGLLTVWTGPAARDHFLDDSVTVRAWDRISDAQWRADLEPRVAKGRWAGVNPFLPVSTDSRPATRVAAITRARLRPSRALPFWRAVPPVTTALRDADGLLLSIGIGEAPIGLQGTFSLWRDERALTGFAYRTAAHRRAITATGEHDWYAEDLFARFSVTATAGTLAGLDRSLPDAAAAHGGDPRDRGADRRLR